MKKLKDFNNEIEAREYFGEKPFENWKKKFDKFVEEKHWSTRCEPWLLTAPDVKQFIQNLLENQREEIKGKIVIVGSEKVSLVMGGTQFGNGYTTALSDILKLLNK